ncbi:MAG: hypothetical protein ACXWF8_05315 [Methylobacter sp.]
MIERDFYSLPVAAKKIGCTVDDLIHLAANEKTQLVVLTYGLKGMKLNQDGEPVTKTIEEIGDRFCFVHHGSMRHFEVGRSSGRNDYVTNDYLNSLLTPDGSGGCWNLSQKDEFIRMSEQTLYILADDLKALTNQLSGKKHSPGKTNCPRLIKLEEFIEFVEKVAEKKGVYFDRLDLPFTKKQLLDELNKRHPRDFNIKIDRFDDIWKAAVSAGICRITRANTKKGEKFLYDIFC